VLMVGAGGIGCELLKTLALSGFQDIHIVSISLFFNIWVLLFWVFPTLTRVYYLRVSSRVYTV
jgi:hypothetical protein